MIYKTVAVTQEPFPENIKEIAQKIGLFYKERFGDIERANAHIKQLGIVDIRVGEGVEVYLERIGLFIGPRGKSIGELETYLGQKVKVFETQSISDFIYQYEEHEDQLDESWNEMYQDEFPEDMDWWWQRDEELGELDDCGK